MAASNPLGDAKGKGWQKVVGERCWTYDAQKDVFQCRVCGKEFKEPGSCQLHHHKVHGAKSQKAEAPAKAAVAAVQARRCKCGGALRLLSEEVGLESAAMGDGWQYVCTKCGDLYRERR